MTLKKTILCALLLHVFVACTGGFLDVKPDKKLVIPATVKDLQALLDRSDLMNQFLPYLGHIGADEYYYNYSDWLSIKDRNRKNGYVWAEDIFEGNMSNDWTFSYQQVFYANNVLDGLKAIDRDVSNAAAYDEAKGAAYFYRAHAFYQLAQLFCAPYEADASNNAPGIPLRRKSGIDDKTVRSSVAETYQQIVSDLKHAAELLPETVILKTRPNRSAALALLARVNLAMQDYGGALAYADEFFPNHSLIDYNTLDENETYPMEQYNDEVIFHSTMSYYLFSTSTEKVDSTLYQSYSDDDLRKWLWYQKNGDLVSFRGSYSGSYYLFCGLASDEVYLIKAECLVRLGRVQEGMGVLNSYLTMRYRKNGFVPIDVADPQRALEIVLNERRKGLAFRGIRWSDLRRLNLEENTQVTLRRVLDEQVYTLEPRGKKYVLPIPDLVIELSGIPQNERE